MRIVLAFALGSAVLACGGSSASDDVFGANGAGSGTTGAGGGSGSTATGTGGPRVALNVEVYGQPEQQCPAGNVHVDVGNASTSPPEWVADGEGGAHVACTIAVKGDKFEVSATIVSGTRSFQVDGLATDGSSAIGHVRIADPATGAEYESTKQRPCLFQFSATDGQTVDAKQLFVGFDCSELESTTDKAKACSSRYGKLRLEGCSAG